MICEPVFSFKKKLSVHAIATFCKSDLYLVQMQLPLKQCSGLEILTAQRTMFRLTGELTDQSFVLTVMFICYIRSYLKWSTLKFPYYLVVSVVISMQWVTGYCGTLIWNSGWNARKPLFTIRTYLPHLQQDSNLNKIKWLERSNLKDC